MQTQEKLKEMVKELLEVIEEGMLSWEIEFIKSVYQKTINYTPEQAEIIEKTWGTIFQWKK